MEESQATTQRLQQRSDNPRPAAEFGTDADDEDNGGVGTLYYQLQLLQDDVRRLQGIVEEQNYRIDRLNREQRERYIELDQRLLELRRGAPPLGDGAMTDAAETDAGEASAAATTERDAYNGAIAVVRNAARLPASERRQEHERALGLFSALIEDHPNGEFTPNAFYWAGEIHLALDNLELARQAFAQVVNLYADHAKAPDALYKLGIAYHRLEDPAKALEYLDRVVRDHPDHATARLARSYAAELR